MGSSVIAVLIHDMNMLKGSQIHLRLMREGDLDEYIRLSHNVAARGEYFPLDLRSEAQIRAKFHADGFWTDDFRTMLIVDQETDVVIGSIGAFKPVFYQDSLELGYILYDTERRGQGIMAEAVRLYCDYLFRWKNIFRIQLQIETPNIPSRRTAEKAGFTHEGTLRQWSRSQRVPITGQPFTGS